MSSSFGIHADVVAPYLVQLTTEEQKQRWLPKFCTGELLTAIGMTEPSGGSDLASLKTTAVKDGDDWIINGSKTFITNGYNADLVIVAARTSPEKKSKGITLFAVETGMEGFERGRKLDKVGQHESDTAELFFENVRVPSTNIIGEIDRGFIHMMEMLPQERVGAAVSNIAHAAPILEETIQYAKDRKAFGQSIGSLQWNKFLLADLVTRVEVTQPTSTTASPHTPTVSSPRWTPPRPSGGLLRCRTRSSTLRAAAWWLRIHDRVPCRPCVDGCPCHQDLGRFQRDHEGTDRPRPRPLNPYPVARRQRSRFVCPFSTSSA